MRVIRGPQIVQEHAGRSGARGTRGPKLVPNPIAGVAVCDSLRRMAAGPRRTPIAPSSPLHGSMFSSIALAMLSAIGLAQFGFLCHPLAGS